MSKTRSPTGITTKEVWVGSFPKGGVRSMLAVEGVDYFPRARLMACLPTQLRLTLLRYELSVDMCQRRVLHIVIWRILICQVEM
jgi:hypothetical protein